MWKERKGGGKGVRGRRERRGNGEKRGVVGKKREIWEMNVKKWVGEGRKKVLERGGRGMDKRGERERRRGGRWKKEGEKKRGEKASRREGIGKG